MLWFINTHENSSLTNVGHKHSFKCLKHTYSNRKLVDEMLQRDNFYFIMVRSRPTEALKFYRMRLRHWNSKLSPASDSWIYNVEWIGFRCGGFGVFISHVWELRGV